MRSETDYNAIALALAERYQLHEVAEKVGCDTSNVGLLARGLTRMPQVRYRHAWVKAYREAFPDKELPTREGKPYIPKPKESRRSA